MCLYTLQSSGGDESDDADEKTCKVTERSVKDDKVTQIHELRMKKKAICLIY